MYTFRGRNSSTLYQDTLLYIFFGGTAVDLIPHCTGKLDKVNLRLISLLGGQKVNNFFKYRLTTITPIVAWVSILWGLIVVYVYTSRPGLSTVHGPSALQGRTLLQKESWYKTYSLQSILCFSIQVMNMVLL